MDQLSESLRPYKDVVDIVASLLGMMMPLTGAVVCVDIWKKGNTNGISVSPFAGGLTMGVLFLNYGLILADEAMLRINVFGLVLNLVSLSIFYWYSLNNEINRKKIYTSIRNSGAFVAVVVGYSWLEDPSVVQQRYGLIITAFIFCLMVWPMIGLKDVNKRDADRVPLPIVITGSLLGVTWLLHAIILNNTFLVIQNGFMLVISVIQLLVYAMFPSKSSDSSAKEKKSKIR